MKKSNFICLALASSLALSQQIISFETDKGLEIGTIHNQNGWTVTEGSDGFLANQIITDENASDGSFSFKNSYESDFDFQWFPIFGAAKEFDTQFSNENFSISYDILVTEQMGADFEFTIFSKDELDEYYPIAGVGMEYQGNMYVINSIDYGYDTVGNVTWEANQWYNIKVEVTPATLNYFLNDELVYTGENYNSVDIAGFNMLHNNYAGSAFYDEFLISTENMNVNDLISNSLKVYPNPVKDILNIEIPSNKKIKDIDIFSLTGEKLMHSAAVESLNLNQLSKGIYILKVTTENGQILTQKIIKR